MPLNDTQDLEAELEQVNVEYTDLDFDRKLNQANNRLIGEVGRTFVERQVIEFEEERSVSLDFNRLESLEKVVNESDEEIIDDSNYTVDLTNGEIEFDQNYVDDNFFEGLVLKFYHVPTSFKDLELFLAVRNILETQTIQTTDGVNNTQVDRLNQRIEASIRRINSKNSTGVQAGDNTNIGSEAPRRFGGS